MSASERWRDRVREVGGAFLGVARAELAAYVADLRASGRALVGAVVAAAVAFAVIFWTVALLIELLVELLALALNRWQAVGVVLAVFLAASVGLALRARARLRAVESPAAALQRRAADTRAWWQERVAQEAAEPDAPGEGEG